MSAQQDGFVAGLVARATDAELRVLVAGGIRWDQDVAQAALAEQRRRLPASPDPEKGQPR